MCNARNLSLTQSSSIPCCELSALPQRYVSCHQRHVACHRHHLHPRLHCPQYLPGGDVGGDALEKCTEPILLSRVGERNFPLMTSVLQDSAPLCPPYTKR